MRRIKIAALLCIVAVILTGCNKERRVVDYNITDGNDESGAGDNVALGGKGLIQFKDAAKWEDSWTVKGADDSDISVKAVAEVTIPDAAQMSVLECTYVEFDEKFIEQTVKSLYGDAAVYYYDAPRRPKTMLEAAIQELTDKIAVDRDNVDNGYYYEEWEDKMNQQIQQNEEILAQCKTNLATATENYIPVAEYNSTTYIGEINGFNYILEFNNNIEGDSGWENYNRQIAIYPQNYKEVIPNTYSGYSWVYTSQGSKYSPTSKVENMCKYTSEDAVKMATEYMTRLGFDKYENISCYNMELYGGEEIDEYTTRTDVEGTDGWIIFFGQAIDETAQLYPENLNTDLILWDEDRLMSPSSDELHYVVIVNDNGVIMCDLVKPYIINGITEDASMISYDSLKGVLKDKIESRKELYNSDLLPDKALEYIRLELLYKKIQDENNSSSFSFVPVWRLKDRLNVAFDIYINAIDGTGVDEFNMDYLIEYMKAHEGEGMVLG